MLLFILYFRISTEPFAYISIHPMLLFISPLGILHSFIAWFQYIPCYCLSCNPWIWLRCCLLISIHPMLLFIHISKSLSDVINVISIHPMLLFIFVQLRFLLIIAYFNTSHVTVYRNHSTSKYRPHEFQYIPCYCLSQYGRFYSQY